MPDSEPDRTPPTLRTSGTAAIDRLRDAAGGLPRSALREILPYGDSFLFLDRIERLSRQEVAGAYTVPRRGAFIEAHFVDLPVMPGALIAEGCAQAGAVLLRYNMEPGDRRELLALHIGSARFDRPAFPGEQLLFAVELKSLRSQVARLAGTVSIAGERAAVLQMDLAILERSALTALRLA